MSKYFFISIIMITAIIAIALSGGTDAVNSIYFLTIIAMWWLLD